MSNVIDLMQPCYLNLKQVRLRYSLGKTWIYNNIRAGVFPAPKKIGGASRWAVKDLLKWEVDNQLADPEEEQQQAAAPETQVQQC